MSLSVILCGLAGQPRGFWRCQAPFLISRMLYYFHKMALLIFFSFFLSIVHIITFETCLLNFFCPLKILIVRGHGLRFQAHSFEYCVIEKNGNCCSFSFIFLLFSSWKFAVRKHTLKFYKNIFIECNFKPSILNTQWWICHFCANVG